MREAAEEEGGGLTAGQWEPVIQIITMLHEGCDNNVESRQYVKTYILFAILRVLSIMWREGSRRKQYLFSHTFVCQDDRKGVWRNLFVQSWKIKGTFQTLHSTTEIN